MDFRESALYRYNDNIFNNYKKEYPALQLGFFNDRKILFIGQNPGQPFGKGEKLTSEVLIKQRFRDFELAYENLIKESKIGNFLSKIVPDFSNISFTNVVKVPTEENEAPSRRLVDRFLPITLEQIKLLEPEIVVCLGRFVGNCFGLHFFYESKCLRTQYYHTHFILVPHPSYLMRTGTLEKEVLHVIDAIKKEQMRRVDATQKHN